IAEAQLMLRRFLQHAVVRNALSLYGITIAGYVLPLLTFPYLARVLGPGKFGLIQGAGAFMGYFLVITEYGFNLSVTREVSIHRDNIDTLCSIYTSAMAARMLLMVVSFAAMAAIVLAVPRLRMEWPLFFISFLTVVGSALFPQWLFQGLERMEYITVREVGARFIGLMTVFVLVRREADYLWAAAIMSGSTAVAGAVGLLYVRRLTGVGLTRTSAAEVRRTLAEGWHVFLSSAAIKIYTTSNTVILLFIASNAEVGYFTSASKLIEAAKNLISPLSTAIYPHVSRKAAGSREAAVYFIRRNLFRLTAPFAIVSLGLLIAAPIGIRIIYGNAYDQAIRLLQIMSPIPFVVALATSFATYYMLGLGYTKQWSRIIVTAGALNFVVLLPLLLVCKASMAVAITGVAIECFVLGRSYMFYRQKQG
ncbi:MAG: polysaccharide biosynthesis protein, partial [Bryobacterales bacterium]|nr:polysaccharide biosynthesis protein [Bryobacterales bacterium]